MTKGYEAIVIGTSAGGFQALSVILQKLPREFRLPIIIVQHRAKDSLELFEEILQRRCTVTVKQADEKEKIRPGTVYIAPPDYHLLVEADRTISLSTEGPVQFSRPSVDVLFESAAMVYREKLIGIVLTGSNNDGAAGISAISRLGGLTIAQDPAEAEYHLMAQAAIDTKNVKHILQLTAIAQLLLQVHNECPLGKPSLLP